MPSLGRARVSLLALLLVLPGCGRLLTLKHAVRVFDGRATIEGRVQLADGGSEPVVVVIYDEATGEVADLFVLPQPRKFFFVLPPGTYRLAAFADRNRDLRHQADSEPAVLFDDEVKIGALGNRSDIDLLIDPDAPPLRIPVTLDAVATDEGGIRKFPAPQLGTVVKLSNPRFSPENASLGLWDPLRFLVTVGAGVYFLEKYDPDKTPVLFVHGALGHPGDWSYLANRIDRSRFQPWFVYYPTAPRLDRIASLLVRALAALHVKYQYPRLVLVAHSMGGLVSRGAINLVADDSYARHSVELPALVTISSPWNGHAAAAKGVERSPVVAPSWQDMAPGSAFLSSLAATPLPSECEHWLLFGFRGRGGRSPNDGTVTVASQLAMPIQLQADRVIGFDETHTSILRSAEVADRLNEILAEVID